MSPSIHVHVIPSRRLEGRAASALTRALTLAELFVGEPIDLVIDLSHVGFIDSLGASALATILRRVPKGSRVVLASPQPSISAIVRMTRLHDVFAIYPDVESAIRALESVKQVING
ncbi:hypothetical protein BH09MYX1_BH09MYX1_24210 [soil metagenome]